MTDRMRRVNESVRQVLSEAVGQLKDPRIGFVTVTGVETSPDLRHARVFVSVLGAERKRTKTLVSTGFTLPMTSDGFVCFRTPSGPLRSLLRSRRS